MSPIAYKDVLANNVRAARGRISMSQKNVVDSMRKLGFTAWHGPTMGNVERGERPLRADELLGLAITLQTTVQQLLSPLTTDGPVELPSGATLSAVEVRSLVSDEERLQEQLRRSEARYEWAGLVHRLGANPFPQAPAPEAGDERS